MKMKKIICAIILISILSPFASPVVRAQENIQFFGSEPLASEQDEGRNLLECLKGWRQFLSAFIGYEGFVDYWRDIFILSWKWPMYFADINNVEMQLNKSRYAVMSAFLRCDTNRLKSVTQAYYRLEAELYFLRHFVDVSGGFLNFKTESRGNRDEFRDEMLDFFALRKESSDPNQDKSLFMGYFDEFEGKYSGRAEQYAGYGDDPIYNDISSKFDDLIKTFKDFGKESAALVGDVADTAVAAVEAGKKGVSALAHPINTLGALAMEAYKRFQICPSGDAADCKTLGEVVVNALREGIEGAKTFGKLSLTLVGGVVATPVAITTITVEKIVDALSGSGIKATPDEVQQILSEVNEVAEAQAEQADMMARYELLYGQVAGDGIVELTNRMDILLGILGPKGSQPPLEKIAKCADYVQNAVCGSM